MITEIMKSLKQSFEEGDVTIAMRDIHNNQVPVAGIEHDILESGDEFLVDPDLSFIIVPRNFHSHDVYPTGLFTRFEGNGSCYIDGELNVRMMMGLKHHKRWYILHNVPPPGFSPTAWDNGYAPGLVLPHRSVRYRKYGNHKTVILEYTPGEGRTPIPGTKTLLELFDDGQMHISPVNIHGESVDILFVADLIRESGLDYCIDADTSLAVIPAREGMDVYPHKPFTTLHCYGPAEIYWGDDPMLLFGRRFDKPVVVKNYQHEQVPRKEWACGNLQPDQFFEALGFRNTSA